MHTTNYLSRLDTATETRPVQASHSARFGSARQCGLHRGGRGHIGGGGERPQLARNGLLSPVPSPSRHCPRSRPSRCCGRMNRRACACLSPWPTERVAARRDRGGSWSFGVGSAWTFVSVSWYTACCIGVGGATKGPLTGMGHCLWGLADHGLFRLLVLCSLHDAE